MNSLHFQHWINELLLVSSKAFLLEIDEPINEQLLSYRLKYMDRFQVKPLDFQHWINELLPANRETFLFWILPSQFISNNCHIASK
jgi:hypothetical protein